MDHKELVKKYAGQLNESHQQLHQARQHIWQLEEALADAKAAHGHRAGDEHQQQADTADVLASLHVELKTKQQRINQLENSISSGDAEIHDLMEQNSQLKDPEQHKIRRLTEFEQDHQHCDEDLRLWKEYGEAIRQPEAKNSTDVAIGRNEQPSDLEARDRIIEQLKLDLQDSQEDYRVLEAEKQQLLKDHAETAEQLQKALDKYSSNHRLLDLRKSEIEGLEARVKGLVKDTTNLETRLRLMKAEKVSLKRQFEAANQRSESRVADGKSSSSQIKRP